MVDIVTIKSFNGDQWRRIDEVRLELSSRWLCIELYTLLLKELARQEAAITAIRESLTFLDHANDDALAASANSLFILSEELLSSFVHKAKPKISWTQLADDFQWLCRENKDLKARGIPAGWIAQRFILPAFSLDEYTPWHARVGVATHAGFISCDDMHLLSDMFYLSAIAHNFLDKLSVARDNHDAIRDHENWYTILTRVKQNVCAYSRQAVVTSCAFVEAFINGLGLDHAARHPQLDNDTIDFLHGRKKGKWVSLDRRLEGIPQIINGSQHPPFTVCDRTQRTEPFKSFFQAAVDTRDGAMHPGKGKATIWLGPYEWAALAKMAVESALQVARTVWQSCKGSLPMPSLLWDLNQDLLISIAKSRVESTAELDGMLRPQPT